MSNKYPGPLPHDTEAEDKEFRQAFASAMIKGNQVSPPAQKPGSELGGSLPGLVGTRFHFVGPFRPSLGVATFHNLPLPSRTRFIYPQDDFQSLDAPDWFPSGSHLGLSCEGHPLTIANAGIRS